MFLMKKVFYYTNGTLIRNVVGVWVLIILDIVLLLAVLKTKGFGFFVGCVLLCFFCFSTFVKLDNIIQSIVGLNTIEFNGTELLLPPFLFFMNRKKMNLNDFAIEITDYKVMLKKNDTCVIFLDRIDPKMRGEFIACLKQLQNENIE